MANEKKNHTQLVRICGRFEEGKEAKESSGEEFDSGKVGNSSRMKCVSGVFARKPKKAKNDVGTVLKC